MSGSPYDRLSATRCNKTVFVLWHGAWIAVQCDMDDEVVMIDGREEKWLFVCVIAGIAAALIGCGGDSGGLGSPSYDGPGTYGATPGGAQDIGYARALIKAGSIPPADAITVEGLLSEHDLPIMGEPCEDLMCVRPVAARAPDLATGEDEMWVHLGMTSGLRHDFERPPLDIVVLVDKSSSMDIDMEETNDAVLDILSQLEPQDRFAVVTFDDTAKTLIEATTVAELNRAEATSEIQDIRAAGGANMLSGLRHAYGVAGEMGRSDERLSRVILLSCGYPTVGDADSFTTVVTQGADNGIGLTFLGILLHFDYALAQRLSTIRGGNYFYLEELKDVSTFFESDFDFIVTPLAYDLRLKLGVGENWELDRLYGLPGERGASEAGFDVSTAFLSRGGGGIVARLRPKTTLAPDGVASVSLAYKPEAALGWGSDVEREVAVSSSADVPDFGVRKSVALVNMAEQMRRAIEDHDVLPLVELHRYLDGEATALEDESLRAEVALVEQLIDLF